MLISLETSATQHFETFDFMQTLVSSNSVDYFSKDAL